MPDVTRILNAIEQGVEPIPDARDHRVRAVWAMPMLHFNGMRSAVMQSGLINLKK